MVLCDEDVQRITGQWAREMEKEERKLLWKTIIEKHYRKG
jgi:hypothetical protein